MSEMAAGWQDAGQQQEVFDSLAEYDYDGESEKSRLAVLLLCLAVGLLGGHRFYVGKVGSGMAILLTFGGFFGIWPLVDLVRILLGRFTDKAGRLIERW